MGSASASVIHHHIHGYQGCIINVNSTVQYTGYGGYPDFGYQVAPGVHYQVPPLSTHAESPDSVMDDWYRENLPETFEKEIVTIVI